MKDLILAVNAGSSSLKLGVFKPVHISDTGKHHEHIFGAVIEDLFTESPKLSFIPVSSKACVEFSEKIRNIPAEVMQSKNDSEHQAAFAYFLEHLKNVMDIGDRIRWIGHRVVHGGTFDSPTFISKHTFHRLQKLSDLAPLHNGPALDVISSCIELLPNAKSYALFDTSFHTTIPDYISSYAIDQTIAEEKGLRKYGFHGLSYSYILRQLSQTLCKPSSECTLIIMHLGSGASICAIKHGKSLDTTMGLTPLDGLPGTTRSGHVDPSLIFHYSSASEAGRVSHEKSHHMHITEAERILNKQSGWKALTGTSNFGTIISQKSSKKNHALAYEIFLDRLTSFLGAYILKLGGSSKIDGIVFAGGIGERSAELRADAIRQCECVGVCALDEDKNKELGEKPKDDKVVEISKDDEGGIRSFVCWTDEQDEMVTILVNSSITSD